MAVDTTGAPAPGLTKDKTAQLTQTAQQADTSKENA